MSKLREAIEGLRRRIGETEKEAEEVLAIISKLDQELKVHRLDQVVGKVRWKLQEAQEMGRDIRGVKLVVTYKGEVDLTLPSEKTSLIFLMGLILEEFVEVLEKTAKLVREGSKLDPFVLLKEMADEKLFPVWRKRKRG